MARFSDFRLNKNESRCERGASCVEHFTTPTAEARHEAEIAGM